MRIYIDMATSWYFVVMLVLALAIAHASAAGDVPNKDAGLADQKFDMYGGVSAGASMGAGRVGVGRFPALGMRGKVGAAGEVGGGAGRLHGGVECGTGADAGMGGGLGGAAVSGGASAGCKGVRSPNHP